jgi:Trk K+ transport system NAD-binding subunit
MLAADYIVRHVKNSNVISVATVPGLAVETVEFIVRKDSPLINQPIYDLDLVRQTRVIIGGVLRKNKPQIIDSSFVLQTGDTIIAAYHHSCRSEFQTLL